MSRYDDTRVGRCDGCAAWIDLAESYSDEHPGLCRECALVLSDRPSLDGAA